MDEPVHGRHAAIYATERKRLPSSLYLALAVALALHAGGAYYLLRAHFDSALPDLPPVVEAPPTIVTMEHPDKPKPPQPNVVRVHASPQAPVVDSPPLITVKPDMPPILGKIDGPPVLPNGPIIDMGSGTAPTPGPVAARWARFPDGNALAEYYPSKASEGEVEGQATVQCVVLDTAGHVSCVIVSESPGGYGFGAATVRMVQDRGRVDTSRGDMVKGATLHQTVNWRLG